MSYASLIQKGKNFHESQPYFKLKDLFLNQFRSNDYEYIIIKDDMDCEHNAKIYNVKELNADLIKNGDNPASICRKTLYSLDYSSSPLLLTGTTGEKVSVVFQPPVFNELNLTYDVNNNISPSLDISNQYVEIIANVKCFTSNGTSFSFDISGVDSGFYESIDTIQTDKAGEYYVTFGSHILTPDEWINTTQFKLLFKNNANKAVEIEHIKLFFKSNYIQEP